ncbi:MAG TPA: PIN domain-containing protein [Gammaproteobacteria bacterium]|nr:PIN domain-containing protein [Gammaproteobacteria bacterium]
MTRRILVDAGPLIAVLDSGDQDHDRCATALKRLPAPLLTTWMPLTEAMRLLAFSREAQDALLEMIERGALRVLPIDENDVVHIKALMRKYSDLPMDFADASLVRVAIRERLTEIFTLDEDFNVYRIGGRKRFAVVQLG